MTKGSTSAFMVDVTFISDTVVFTNCANSFRGWNEHHNN